MSYNIKCTFFTDENGNQEIVSKGIINNLKIINSQKYSISFDDVNTTTDDIKLSNTEIYGHYYKEYSYSVPSDIIIEFNGLQHYGAVDFWGGEKVFQKQKNRDETVRMYCKDNNIRLLEIPYAKMGEINILTELSQVNIHSSSD